MKKKMYYMEKTKNHANVRVYEIKFFLSICYVDTLYKIMKCCIDIVREILIY